MSKNSGCVTVLIAAVLSAVVIIGIVAVAIWWFMTYPARIERDATLSLRTQVLIETLDLADPMPEVQHGASSTWMKRKFENITRQDQTMTQGNSDAFPYEATITYHAVCSMTAPVDTLQECEADENYVISAPMTVTVTLWYDRIAGKWIRHDRRWEIAEGGEISEQQTRQSARLGSPDNAVSSGSFTAWITPTFGHPDRGEYYHRRLDEPDPQPGDSPRPGQPYSITIQIEVPEEVDRLPIRDLSGTVVGSDGYRQRLPEHMYIPDRDGEPTRPRGTSIPVVNGVAQVVVFVPGARESIKDTVEIHSELLNESQTLELVFERPR